MVYIKVPYEMSDEVVTTALLPYGTVVDIRRQVHVFDSEIETGVRSVLVKNMKKQIPSYVEVGGFTLPIKGNREHVRYVTNPAIARNCDLRGRCFVCGSYEHRAGWHERQKEEEESDTPSSISIREEREKYDAEKWMTSPQKPGNILTQKRLIYCGSCASKYGKQESSP